MAIFCLPYAGGNAWAYRALESHVRPGVAVTSMELPGRGRRSREPLLHSLDALADDVFGQLATRVPDEPFVLYGHSMGALLAWLVAHRLRDAKLPQPAALVLTGCEAPSAQTPRRRHELTTSDFIDMLREMGGCPPEVLADRELVEFFEPVLRADFRAIETWIPSWFPPLDVPISVLIGSNEDVDAAHARPWANETTGPFTFDVLNGNHFFIVQHWHTIGALLSRHVVQEPQLRT